MRAEEAAAHYTLLTGRGVRVWVDGGWGVDALLGEQTRAHKDLDVLVDVDDLGALAAALAGRGFALKEIWRENRWIARAATPPLIGRAGRAGGEVATAFVLRDAAGRELDVHALAVGRGGGGVAAWASDLAYRREDLAGRGVVAGTPVRCVSARMQVATHSGYVLQAKDLQDLRHLHERFGVAYLEEQARHFSDGE